MLRARPQGLGRDMMPHRVGAIGAALGCLLLMAMLGGCATVPRRPNVGYAPNGNLVVLGLDADRSRAFFEARNEAQRYCWVFEAQKKPMILSQTTVYQGRYDEQLTEAGRVAGRVGGVFDQPQIAQAGRILSSPTDYETRIEFQCR